MESFISRTRSLVAESTLVLGALALGACGERTPPPGSGALETTPTASVAQGPELGPISTPVALAYPNGAVAITDPSTCRVVNVRDGEILGQREFAGCGGLLEATVALDSVLYVRGLTALFAIDPERELLWTVKLLDPPPGRALSSPVTLADSRVALAATANSVVVYDRNGNTSWSFSAPAGEALVAAPAPMNTGGLILITSGGVYQLSAAGQVHQRMPAPEHAARH